MVPLPPHIKPHPQEHLKRQRASRESTVVLYRKYRKGELPDIQIKHAELIRPFQALAQVRAISQCV